MRKNRERVSLRIRAHRWFIYLLHELLQRKGQNRRISENSLSDTTWTSIYVLKNEAQFKFYLCDLPPWKEIFELQDVMMYQIVTQLKLVRPMLAPFNMFDVHRWHDCAPDNDGIVSSVRGGPVLVLQKVDAFSTTNTFANILSII